MSIENARQFVGTMRQEEEFRAAALKAATDNKLSLFLENHGQIIELNHLVVAMAECMDELAGASINKKKA